MAIAGIYHSLTEFVAIADRAGGTQPAIANNTLKALQRRFDILIGLYVLAAAVVVALLLVPALATIGVDVQKTYNEGWNAYYAGQIAAGSPLYTGNPELLVNYPFLSFYLIAWLKPWFGNLLVIGRVLNAGAFACTGLLAALVVRRLGGGVIGPIFSGVCTLGFQVLQASTWVATDEPQMLAEALMLGGLLCYVSGSPTIMRLAACAILLAAGGFVKQILLAVPLAVSLDLLGKDRRRFVLWCICGTAAISFFVGVSTWFAGGLDWLEIFTPRPYFWHNVTYISRKIIIVFKISLAIEIIFLFNISANPYSFLLRCLAIFALTEGVILSGGDGVSVNIYLEFTVILGIVSGLALGQWRDWRDRRFGAPVGAVIALLAGDPLFSRGLLHLTEGFDLEQDAQRYRREEATYHLAASYLKQAVGPVFCEDLLLCLQAGKTSAIDTFSVHSQALAGRLDEAGFAGDIARQRFRLIELTTNLHMRPDDPAFTPYVVRQGRFSKSTLVAIDRYYEPVFVAEGAALLAPRENPVSADH